MIIDFSDFRLGNAREFGLLTCNPRHEDVQTALFEAFGSRPAYGGMKCAAQVYIDCIGVQGSIDYFNQFAGYGAVLSIVGTHNKPPMINALSVCFNQQHIMGCGSYHRAASAAHCGQRLRDVHLVRRRKGVARKYPCLPRGHQLQNVGRRGRMV